MVSWIGSWKTERTQVEKLVKSVSKWVQLHGY